jgi:uncharacterized membrane protein YdjX (TVP38/TMEM64 family)
MKNQINNSLNPSWLRAHADKLVAFLFWAAVLIGYQVYTQKSGLNAVQVMQQFLGLLSSRAWGPIIYVLLYSIRPLILFPSSILTLAGGFIFGPILGVVYTIIASNISATIAFFVGRYFGQGLIEEGSTNNTIQRYAERMRQNSFTTIMIMRFIFLPYDMVNYFAGFMRIRWVPFILATFLGSIPGTVAFTLAGASFESFEGGVPELNPATLVASVFIFIVSLVLSRSIKKREGIENGNKSF